MSKWVSDEEESVELPCWVLNFGVLWHERLCVLHRTRPDPSVLCNVLNSLFFPTWGWDCSLGEQGLYPNGLPRLVATDPRHCFYPLILFLMGISGVSPSREVGMLNRTNTERTTYAWLMHSTANPVWSSYGKSWEGRGETVVESSRSQQGQAVCPIGKGRPWKTFELSNNKNTYLLEEIFF